MKVTVIIPTVFLDLFCQCFGYQPFIADEKGEQIKNPESREQYAQRQLESVVDNAILSQDANAAQDAARAKSLTEIPLRIAAEKAKEQ